MKWASWAYVPYIHMMGTRGRCALFFLVWAPWASVPCISKMGIMGLCAHVVGEHLVKHLIGLSRTEF